MNTSNKYPFMYISRIDLKGEWSGVGLRINSRKSKMGQFCPKVGHYSKFSARSAPKSGSLIDFGHPLSVGHSPKIDPWFICIRDQTGGDRPKGWWPKSIRDPFFGAEGVENFEKWPIFGAKMVYFGHFRRFKKFFRQKTLKTPKKLLFWPFR